MPHRGRLSDFSNLRKRLYINPDLSPKGFAGTTCDDSIGPAQFLRLSDADKQSAGRRLSDLLLRVVCKIASPVQENHNRFWDRRYSAALAGSSRIKRYRVPWRHLIPNQESIASSPIQGGIRSWRSVSLAKFHVWWILTTTPRTI